MFAAAYDAAATHQLGLRRKLRTKAVAVGFTNAAKVETPITPVQTPNIAAWVRLIFPDASGRASVRFIFLSLSISITCKTVALRQNCALHRTKL